VKHARQDYAPIQDPRGLIPKDEPVFLLRAQDVCAPFAVLEWAFQAEHHGANQIIVESAKKQAQLMRDWQTQQGMKIPDMP